LPFQINVTGGGPVLFDNVRRPRHQPSGFGEDRRLIDCRYAVLRREVDD
jgi:hypothetical protein